MLLLLLLDIELSLFKIIIGKLDSKFISRESHTPQQSQSNTDITATMVTIYTNALDTLKNKRRHGIRMLLNVHVYV